MTAPVITEADLDAVDLSKPLPVEDSPILKQDLRKSKLLMERMGNPLDVQKYSVAEYRAIVTSRLQRDIDEHGIPTESTTKMLHNNINQLSDLHKNMYGTKSMQMNIQGKVTHAQIASLMKQAIENDFVVDVVPEPIISTEEKNEELPK